MSSHELASSPLVKVTTTAIVELSKLFKTIDVWQPLAFVCTIMHEQRGVFAQHEQVYFTAVVEDSKNESGGKIKAKYHDSKLELVVGVIIPVVLLVGGVCLAYFLVYRQTPAHRGRYKAEVQTVLSFRPLRLNPLRQGDLQPPDGTQSASASQSQSSQASQRYNTPAPLYTALKATSPGEAASRRDSVADRFLADADFQPPQERPLSSKLIRSSIDSSPGSVHSSASGSVNSSPAGSVHSSAAGSTHSSVAGSIHSSPVTQGSTPAPVPADPSLPPNPNSTTPVRRSHFRPLGSDVDTDRAAANSIAIRGFIDGPIDQAIANKDTKQNI
jgi:hypothetical protein